MISFARKIIAKKIVFAKNSVYKETLDTTKIISELDDSTRSVVGEVKGLSFESFNYRKEKGAWSVGDCVEHLVMIEKAASSILVGPVKYYDREFDMKIPVIRKAFGDDTKKFTAGKEIAPKESAKSSEQIIVDFINNREEIKKVIMKEDLTVLCDSYRHPLFGHFTRIEWIYYVIYHSRRHARQIERIIASIPK